MRRRAAGNAGLTGQGWVPTDEKNLKNKYPRLVSVFYGGAEGLRLRAAAFDGEPRRVIRCPAGPWTPSSCQADRDAVTSGVFLPRRDASAPRHRWARSPLSGLSGPNIRRPDLREGAVEVERGGARWGPRRSPIRTPRNV